VAADVDAFEMLELRAIGGLEPGQNPGPVASILKLRSSRIRQAISELGIEVLGLESLRWRAADADDVLGTLLPEYLNSRAHTIFGGAAEVQLGIIAKTILHL
jgi:acyl-CoA dehydrogenase